MKNQTKIIIVGVSLATVLIFVIVGIVGINVPFSSTLFGAKEEISEENGVALNGSLAPEVDAILKKKTALIEDLVRDPIIVNAVLRANEENRDLSQEDILEIDERWRSEGGVSDELIQTFLTNETAFRLIEFQEEFPGFSEIFITDERGLNVGQTNKTTDFYQADENWWVESYNEGSGKVFYGPIEFDESAQAEAISLYVPVRNPETNATIGVAKAVLSVAAIKIEL